MFGFIRKYFSSDLAIDLGTANTRIYVRAKGLALDEPSVVAMREDSTVLNKVAGVGREAKQMLGKVPGNMRAIKPIKDGVISDFTVTQEMLRQFIRSVHDSRVFSPNPRVTICVPCG